MWLVEIPFEAWFDGEQYGKIEIRKLVQDLINIINESAMNSSNQKAIQKQSKELLKDISIHRLSEFLYAQVQFEIETDQLLNKNYCLQIVSSEDTRNEIQDPFFKTQLQNKQVQLVNTQTNNVINLKLVLPNLENENSYHRNVTAEILKKEAVIHSPFCLRLSQEADQSNKQIVNQQLKLKSNQIIPRTSVFNGLLNKQLQSALCIFQKQTSNFKGNNISTFGLNVFDIFDGQVMSTLLPANISSLEAQYLQSNIGNLNDEKLGQNQSNQLELPEMNEFKNSFEAFLKVIEDKTNSLRQKVMEARMKKQQESTKQEETSIHIQSKVLTCLETATPIIQESVQKQQQPQNQNFFDIIYSKKQFPDRLTYIQQLKYYLHNKQAEKYINYDKIMQFVQNIDLQVDNLLNYLIKNEYRKTDIKDLDLLQYIVHFNENQLKLLQEALSAFKLMLINTILKTEQKYIQMLIKIIFNKIQKSNSLFTNKQVVDQTQLFTKCLVYYNHNIDDERIQRQNWFQNEVYALEFVCMLMGERLQQDIQDVLHSYFSNHFLWVI